MSKKMIALSGGMVSAKLQPSVARETAPPLTENEAKELVNFRVTKAFRRELRHMAADANMSLSDLLVAMAAAYREKQSHEA